MVHVMTFIHCKSSDVKMDLPCPNSRTDNMHMGRVMTQGDAWPLVAKQGVLSTLCPGSNSLPREDTRGWSERGGTYLPPRVFFLTPLVVFFSPIFLRAGSPEGRNSSTGEDTPGGTRGGQQGKIRGVGGGQHGKTHGREGQANLIRKRTTRGRLARRVQKTRRQNEGSPPRRRSPGQAAR